METGAQPVIVWTVDDRSDAEPLFAGGVNSIITNRIQDFLGE
jgi:glycerophosphoryl diester phosphodiesterase